MPRLGRIMTHLRLVLRMAQATGADLATAHRDGHLSQQEWADMVQLCRGCEWARACPDWLNENETAESAPCTCPNRHRFATLRVSKQR
ncbi:DUF6455 family protein [Ruegeria sp. SCSIO 43209]|uniref:DUF6455 family protein n=1 Tax=Ruegeria sp. SCSIO 43209 TaxID=2793010 RepID=UPI00351CFC85